MKTRVQREGLVPAVVLEGTQSVVIYDDFDQPILAAKRTERGQILVTKAGDKDFKEILETMGIGLNARVIVAPRVAGGVNHAS